MMADGSADFAKAIGLTLDLTARGMGVRSQRYSMLVEDGVVKTLNIEAPGKFEVSDAETMLKQAKALEPEQAGPARRSFDASDVPVAGIIQSFAEISAAPCGAIPASRLRPDGWSSAQAPDRSTGPRLTGGSMLGSAWTSWGQTT